jgi:hypothetical protein
MWWRVECEELGRKVGGRGWSGWRRRREREGEEEVGKRTRLREK